MHIYLLAISELTFVISNQNNKYKYVLLFIEWRFDIWQGENVKPLILQSILVGVN